MLVLPVAENLNKLLQDGRLAAVALLGVLSRIVVMAVNITVVFVVAVLGAKYGRAERTCKVIDMILSFQGGDVRATERTTALVTEQA